MENSLFLNQSGFEVLTDDGFKDFDGYLLSKKITYLIKFTDGTNIRATADHKLLTIENEFVEIINLKENDTIKSKDGDKIVELILECPEEDVVDLVNVNETHSYYTNDVISHNCLYVDEFGIIAPNLSREFYTAIKPTLATGGKMIITSTPMSDEDQFADIWFGSQNKFDDQGEKIPNGEGRNGFYGMKYIWSDHPDRDDKWAKEWQSSMDIRKFRQEFCCVRDLTKVKIRSKTGENSQITMGELFDLLK